MRGGVLAAFVVCALAPGCRDGAPPRTSELLDVVVILDQGPPCHTGGPTYCVTLRGDGTAAYEGRCAVERLGSWEARLPEGALRRLVDSLFDDGFIALDPNYLMRSGAVTWVSYAKDTTRVEHYTTARGGWGRYDQESDVVARAAKRIDELVASLEWTKTPWWR